MISSGSSVRRIFFTLVHFFRVTFVPFTLSSLVSWTESQEVSTFPNASVTTRFSIEGESYDAMSIAFLIEKTRASLTFSCNNRPMNILGYIYLFSFFLCENTFSSPSHSSPSHRLQVQRLRLSSEVIVILMVVSDRRATSGQYL